MLMWMEKSPFFILRGHRPPPTPAITIAPLMTGRSTFGVSVGGTGLACGADQPVRLHQDTGFLSLRAQREADRNKCEAKHHTDDRNAPIGLPVGMVKRWAHAMSVAQR